MPYISKDYRQALRVASHLSLVSVTAQAILLNLEIRANSRNGLCWPSIPRLSQDTGIPEETINSAIEELAQVGLIEIIPGRWRRYRLTPERFLELAGRLESRGTTTEEVIEQVEKEQQTEAGEPEEPAIAALPPDPPPPPVVVPSLPKEEPPSSPIGPPPADILPSILELGIPARVAHSLLSAGEALVTSWLDALRLKLVTPRNPAGFLRRAIEERWQPPKERAKGRERKPEPEPSSHEANARRILAARYASLEAALSG